MRLFIPPPGGLAANDTPLDAKLDAAVAFVAAELERLAAELAVEDPDGFQVRRLRQRLSPYGYYRVQQTHDLMDVVRQAYHLGPAPLVGGGDEVLAEVAEVDAAHELEHQAAAHELDEAAGD